MTQPIMKGLGAFEIKDAEKGEVEAVVATLGVIDRDGDIITRTAIADGAKVKMSSYGHDAMFGAIPVGKGALAIDGDRVVFRGKVFLGTARGRETFDVLKEMGADQEWSFGFRVLGSETPSEEDRKRGAYQVLTKLGAFEVSPVMIGAGVGTRTLGVKEGDPAADPAAIAAAEQAAAEEAATALAAAEAERLAAEATATAAAEAKALEDAAAKAVEEAELKAFVAAEYERFQRNMRQFKVA